LAPLACALALAILRISLLPLYTAYSFGFSHDSAYIGIVARNLLNGNGWVNDGSWLVFLHPARLPMPYRNANPLYPLSTAITAKVCHISVVQAGFLVAALASVLLLLGTFYLVTYYLNRTGAALTIAIAVTIFPSIWEDSLRMLPDSLHLALLMAGLAFFVRAEKPLFAAAAGIVFGAAWLTRSTAALIAPALVVYAFMTWGSRKGWARLAITGAVALVVASPWLIYSAHVWGSPFGSDSAYSVFQDFYARAYGGSSDLFWHSPIPPPGPLALLRREPGAVLIHTVTGVPKVLRIWLRAGWEDEYIPRIVFVIGLVAAAIVYRRRFREAPLLASVVFMVTQIGIFAIRADTVEPRYLAPFTAFAVLWLCCAIAALPARRLHRYVVIAGLAACAIYLTLQDARLVRQFTAENTETATWRRDRIRLSTTITNRDPVVVADPYLYSFDTGAQALSIPTSDDTYLMRYMDEYHTRWIMLTNAEVRFWKPQWESQLPSWLRVRATFKEGNLFERMAY
jgi:4-amino-4-deoxy-L-arabinose transferase-like glycosyltransferase